jgi:predicted enzyme related to lactoylglutathione lyase
MPAQIVHLQIRAAEPETLVRFYSEVLGLSFDHVALTDTARSVVGGYGWADAARPEAVSLGVADEGRSAGMVPWVRVEDVLATLDDVRRLNGTVLGEPTEMELTGAPSLGGRLLMAWFLDPERNAVTLVQQETSRPEI